MIFNVLSKLKKIEKTSFTLFQELPLHFYSIMSYKLPYRNIYWVKGLDLCKINQEKKKRKIFLIYFIYIYCIYNKNNLYIERIHLLTLCIPIVYFSGFHFVYHYHLVQFEFFLVFQNFNKKKGVFMSRYRGPRFKKIRRLGALPGLTSKRPRAGSDLRNQSRSGKKSQYRIRLEEKQKLRFHYGLTERQLLKYVRIAGTAKGSTGQVLLQLLEMRLDNTLFRLGMALTIPQARQLVNHRHILVNGRIVDIPSYRCKPRDIITVKDEQKSRTLVQNLLDSSAHEELPKHLTLHTFQYEGLVNQIIDRKCVGLKINELLVVEYYSRQT